MKSSDALLAAWQRILGGAKDSPAILNTHGEVVRTFSAIDEAARDFERDSAGAQVKNGFGVELADGCAVSAFHVIGEYLQLRFGVDRGVVR